jgi:hypothetical protein
MQMIAPNRLVLVSNRLPIVLAQSEEGKWRIERGDGGLISALAPNTSRARRYLGRLAQHNGGRSG